MKQVLTVVAVMLLLAMPCRAAGEPEQVEGLDELWQAAESYGVEPDGDLSGGLSGLGEQLLGPPGLLPPLLFRHGEEKLYSLRHGEERHLGQPGQGRALAAVRPL